MSERFEYKLVEAPQRRRRGKAAGKNDMFAETVTDIMNVEGRAGWQFIRKEIMDEVRGLPLLRKRVLHHEYLVFRRPLRSAGISLDQPVAPRRVRSASVPDIESVRARIAADSAAALPAAE